MTLSNIFYDNFFCIIIMQSSIRKKVLFILQKKILVIIRFFSRDEQINLTTVLNYYREKVDWKNKKLYSSANLIISHWRLHHSSGLLDFLQRHSLALFTSIKTITFFLQPAVLHSFLMWNSCILVWPHWTHIFHGKLHFLCLDVVAKNFIHFHYLPTSVQFLSMKNSFQICHILNFFFVLMIFLYLRKKMYWKFETISLGFWILWCSPRSHNWIEKKNKIEKICSCATFMQQYDILYV